MRRQLLPEAEVRRRLLVDSNLLVLYVVGSVNINRISQFKRTAKYDAADYQLLTDVMGRFPEICTVPQVMTEVSNLTDMDGREKALARDVLRRVIHLAVESAVSSTTSSDHGLFSPLGITDAAIAAAAKELDCMVLTDDLPLYVRLTAIGLPAINFTHLRERSGIL